MTWVDFDTVLSTWAAANASVAEDAVKATINVKTGATQGSIAGAANGSEIQVDGDGIAGILMTGSAAHEIEGNPWLYWEGAAHPVRRVHHPGTQPYPFVENAIDAMEEQLVEALADACAADWSSN